MPDRFTLDGPMDLGRRSDDREGPECECSFRGDTADATFCDLHNPVPWRTWGEPDAGERRAA
jgi:hypothetical protein